ncbi:hypothetical protein BKM12_24060 [Pseudomonas syringae pv. syringae]|nr:hypothetical protein BKM12_24060 [Pseudomonas syringae pv. syringae]
MTIKLMLESLSRVINSISIEIPSATWFGFGSFFLGSEHFSDIDLLVTCANQREAAQIYEACFELWSEWPIDLLIMTETEEASTTFIAKFGCVPLPEGLPSWRLG